MKPNRKPESVIRHERRTEKTKSKSGVRIPVVKFLEERAKDLPTLNDSKDGTVIDHGANLRKLWMKGGKVAVDGYVRRVHAVAMRDGGTNLLTRLLGRILTTWYRITD